MLIKSFLLVFVAAQTVWATEKTQFIVSHQSENLIMESNKLKVSGEPTIQAPERQPVSRLGVGIGYWNLQNQVVQIDDRSSRYDIQNPGMRILFESEAFVRNLNLGAALGYSFVEQHATQPTALHLIPLEIFASYHIKNSSVFTPFARVGGAAWFIVQRGMNQDEGSFARWTAMGTLGVATSLSGVGFRNTEVDLTYTRSFGSVEETLNLNGEFIMASGVWRL